MTTEDNVGLSFRRELGPRVRPRSGSADSIRSNGRQSDDGGCAESDTEERHTTVDATSWISTRDHKLPGGTGGLTGRHRKLPEWFRESSQGLAEQYFQSFQTRCDRIFDVLQKSDGQLVRDVYEFESAQEIDDFLRILQEDKYYNRGLLTVCRDGNHFHVAHDCARSNGTCRCNWFQKAQTYGLGRRRDRRGFRCNASRSRSKSDISMLLIYYCTSGRTTIFQKIQGRMERLPSSGYHMEKAGLAELRQYLQSVSIEIPSDRDELQQWEPVLEPNKSNERVHPELPRRKKRKMGAYEYISEKALNLLMNNPMCPPEGIVKHRLWRSEDALKFKNLTDKEVKSAMQVFKDTLTTWSIHDFQNLYNNKNCNPVFSAGYTSVDTYYYNVEESLAVMIKLIEYQFCNESDVVLDFVNTLFDVLERKRPKLNCIVVHSEPSAGKNFFFDAIRDYYINSGHLCNANKYNNFPFQDAEGRRLVFWNEPNYSPEFLEPIKEILGGDSTSVNVKYQHDTPVYRTPVIVTTNNVVSFMTHPAFKDRIRQYEWQPAPFLRDYGKKPHPLAVYEFFKYFNVIE